ncbi:DUF6612 family protein [Paludifilum halophilum]|nr:DUF6612 family protein [Paludifilum halophilum]
MKHPIRPILLSFLSVCVLFSGCTPLNGDQEDPENLEAKKEQEQQEKLKQMSAEEIIDHSLSAMEKMKGYRWKSSNKQQYSFSKKPKKDTTVVGEQQVDVISRPLRIHVEGTLSFSRELESQTKPQKGYVTDKKAYLFTNNRWYWKKRSGSEEEMKVYTDPLWVLREVQKRGKDFKVDREGREIILSAALEGSSVDPFVDRRSLELASIHRKDDLPFRDEKMMLRIQVDKKTLRLSRMEQAVEFETAVDKQKVRSRQEWTHVLKGKVSEIAIPERIRNTAAPLPEEEQDEKSSSR